MNEAQILRMTRKILAELKSQNIITYKAPESKVFDKAISLIQRQYDIEKDLEREAHSMMDDLERQNPGAFERHKMFPMLKKRLAKEKGIIL